MADSYKHSGGEGVEKSETGRLDTEVESVGIVSAPECLSHTPNGPNLPNPLRGRGDGESRLRCKSHWACPSPGRR